MLAEEMHHCCCWLAGSDPPQCFHGSTCFHAIHSHLHLASTTIVTSSVLLLLVCAVWTQDNCLALMGSSKVSRAVQQAASGVLLQLVQGLQQSLQLYNNPELARSEYADALASAAAAAAAGEPLPTDLSSWLNPFANTAAGNGGGGSGVLAGFKDAAKTLAAVQAPLLDPSCPNSYPQLPLPDVGVTAAWGLQGGGLQQQQQREVVDVTAAMTSICLQVGAGVEAGRSKRGRGGVELE